MAFRMPCECRLCDWRGDGWTELDEHLIGAHERRLLGDDMMMVLHAAKDYPDRSENTFGLYDAENKLFAVIVKTTIRSADDPMRDEFWG